MVLHVLDEMESAHELFKKDVSSCLHPSISLYWAFDCHNLVARGTIVTKPLPGTFLLKRLDYVVSILLKDSASPRVSTDPVETSCYLRLDRDTTRVRFQVSL